MKIHQLGEKAQEYIDSRNGSMRRILGCHYSRKYKTMVIRAFIPDAEKVFVLRKDTNKQHPMRQIHAEGLYEALFQRVNFVFKYRFVVFFSDGSTRILYDPYSLNFTTFSDYDIDQFSNGRHLRIFEKLGAHLIERDGIRGVNFAFWSPSAQGVSLVGSFNNWDGRCHQMKLINDSGIWEIFVPDISEGEIYQYEIRTVNGDVYREIDPYAFYSENSAGATAITYELDGKYEWHDRIWMAKRKEHGFDNGFSIYELNMSKWLEVAEKVNGNSAYKDLTVELVPYLKKMEVTHLIISHNDNVSGDLFKQYSIYEKFGTPEEFMGFVNECHQCEISVILDWMPGEHPNSLTLNYIIPNALFWIRYYHIDGFRTSSEIVNLCSDYINNKDNYFPYVQMYVRGYDDYPCISDEDVNNIVNSCHHDPFAILGPHYNEEENRIIIRTFSPFASQIYIIHNENSRIISEMSRVHADGLFEMVINGENENFRYRFRVVCKDGGVNELIDPYSVKSSNFSDFDCHLFAQGTHYDIFEKLGAHVILKEGIKGVNFAVWAPNASRVSVIGPFNQWDSRCHQMRLLQNAGIWEIFIPNLKEGELYKYEIRIQKGDVLLKTDPYAFYTEVPPKTASVVYDFHDKYTWQDDEWMSQREHTDVWRSPVSIYEVHVGSWVKKSDSDFLSYTELASRLIPYVKEMGFTHIELLPIAEHPYYPSWGYQISNFYAPTSRYGRPEDLMKFIDLCHQNNVGVILDWVPAHFPKDAHALAAYDGSCLYEHADPRRGEHRDWGTLIFNYGRHEVNNFLTANALFWLEKYHFDGLRVDAVASMLYLDYSRKAGEWIPNKFGGNENLEAIEFLKVTNSIVNDKFPGVMMIAEESTSWPSVSRPVQNGGLGFGFKWNMGWMHDVLHYMNKDSIHRSYHHKNLTFGLIYAFNENFILSLSHDEVVHLKGALIEKMSGDIWEKFANLRLLYAFMFAHPGKKLLFMGGEFAQWNEWDYSSGLDWHLLERDSHSSLHRYVRDLNGLYQNEKALHEVDFRSSGFEWIEVDNADENVIAFSRKARDPRNCLFFIMNFSSVHRDQYRIGVPFPVHYYEILNSDAVKYGGSGDVLDPGGVMAEETPWREYEFSIELSLPPLSAIILKPQSPENRSILNRDQRGDEKGRRGIKVKGRNKKKRNALLNKKKKKDFWKDQRNSIYKNK